MKLRTQSKNANKHTLHGMRLLEKSLQQDGWIGAQTATADGEMISGSARLEVAADKFADVEPIIVESDGTRPVVVVRTDIPTIDDPRAKRLSIADNQIAHTDLDFDGDLLKEWAAEDEDIKKMFAESEWSEITGEEKPVQDAEPQIDRAAELLEKWQVKTGDLWQIGEHRLICGDCTDAAVVARVMGGKKADMVFTDPPYGIEYDNTERWEGLKKQSAGAARNRGAMIEGDDKEFDPSFILSEFSYCKEIFLSGMQYYLGALPNGGVVVWNRKMVEQKDTPFADFELFWSKQQRHKMAWITWGGWKSKEKGEERLHTTQKPVALAEWFFKQWSKEGEIIIDLYSGAGFTLVACQNLGRKGRTVEISPAYCSVQLERMATAFPELEIKRLE